MRHKLRLVPSRGNKDAQREEVIKCLETALREARAGQLPGLLLVKRYSGGEWDRASCGTAHTDTTWSMTMLFAFLQHLGNQVNES